MDTFTEKLAEFIGQLSYEQLPVAAVEASKCSILDCLGVAVAGCEEDASRIVAEYVRTQDSKGR